MRQNGARSHHLWWSVLVLIVALPPRAQAHLTLKGVNDFWAGALHPVLTPAHILVLLSLGLELGQRSGTLLRYPLAAFASLSAVGLAVATLGGIAGIHPVILTGLALITGALVALKKQLPQFFCSALVGAGALAMGLDSGVDWGTPTTVFVTLLGTWIALNVVLMNLIYGVSQAAEQPRQWLHIGIRVAGSWIVAISLLMLAFALRK